MSYAARNEDWARRGYGPRWSGPPFPWLHPMWIVLMILGFIFWWPLGLIILGIIIGSRKMACWSARGYENWQDRMQEKMDRMRAKMDSFSTGPWGSSGNRAFDEYRTETLRRLEEEQREFRAFLQRLRMAKDKAEFDQFMAERRSRGEPPPPPPQS
jgi:Protein of unknown function (DUF2852)